MTDKERLDAQERAIQILANFNSLADVSFRGYVEQQLRKWHDASENNMNTSEAEKAKTAAFHDEINRLLTPRKSDFV
ncbi:hypothetical protein [Methylorubrum extorquens]|uniref:hypothetical protein n=1 Tax=Methylorubrum extorquens TaxID=408 RepID=UPI0020A183AE|nr:hypothetical protein [Methylorubrum extorquens]MCP1540026.1 hypothetical protein [Methylorubrum extorquens]